MTRADMVRIELDGSPAGDRRDIVADSLAVGQRSVRDPSMTYPLWPPLTEGCPRTSTSEIQYPVEVSYATERADPASLFADDGCRTYDRWQPLLPPLARGLDLGIGGTPLVAAPRLAAFAGSEAPVYVKDESRGPTWSHKDRLNLVTTSAAVLSDAPGIVVSSSGNHGASAAALAAAAGLPCVVLTSTGIPRAIEAFLRMQGKHDGVLITNMPDGVAAAGLAAAVGATGAVGGIETHQLFDHDEQAAIVQHAATARNAYKPLTA